jgi:hypothetical protein
VCVSGVFGIITRSSALVLKAFHEAFTRALRADGVETRRCAAHSDGMRRH